MKNLFKTTFQKGRDGWQAVTMATVAGVDYRISTYKGSSGKITCSSQRGQISEDGNFSFAMFSDENLQLVSEKAVCTEAKVKEIHAKGLEQFTILKADAKEPYKIEVGQIFFTDFINGGDEQRRAVYEVIGHGRFKTVLLDGSDIHTDDHVRPYSEKFGIGVYYNEGDKISVTEVNSLLIQARENIKQREERKEIERIRLNAERLEKIEAGRNLVTVPDGVNYVIVAKLHKRDNDPYSDYIDSTVSKVVYLAFSKHKRDLFPELRKACLNADIEEIRELAEADEDAEHREKYSMGSGYYLSKGYKSGWQVSKESLSSMSPYGITIEDLYIAAAEGRYFCNNSNLEETPAPQIEKVEVPGGSVQVIEYGEKAIAVIGDTRPIKDKLKALGGRFNFRLTCGAGWIFPKSRLTDLQNALSN